MLVVHLPGGVLMEYTDLLGTKFAVHGRGKDEGFDCYGPAIEVLRRNGIVLPDVWYADFGDRLAVENELVAKVEKIEEREVNCLVEIEVHGLPVHMAVYIGNGYIIHALYRVGVIIEPLRKYKNRIRGYYRVRNNQHI